MSETGKRNPDRMNMIGVVVVGICGAVLVYVSIALLQAYYMNDTSQVEHRAEYGGQDKELKALRSSQLLKLDPPQGIKNASGDTFSIRIDRAMDLVAEEAKKDASQLVPSQGASDKKTVSPEYGRPKPLAGSGSAAGTGSGSAAGAGSGSGAGSGATPPPVPTTDTGAAGGGGAAGASPSAAAAGGSAGSANPATAGSGSGGHGP